MMASITRIQCALNITLTPIFICSSPSQIFELYIFSNDLLSYVMTENKILLLTGMLVRNFLEAGYNQEQNIQKEILSNCYYSFQRTKSTSLIKKEQAKETTP
jgi:hypothetical protein